MNHSILCVDDESDILDSLERAFHKKFNVLKANSGKKGIALLEKQEVSVIISDQRMPEMTGVEFLKESQRIQPECIRILLTGHTDISSVVGAINSGQVYRYITKPWDTIDLTNTVEKAAETYAMSRQIKQKNIELKKALDELKTLDQAKSQFMILINHELKTPLTVITSFLDLLKDTALDKEQTQYASRIEEGTFKLTHLIEDVLDIISIEAGVLDIFKETLSNDRIFKSDYAVFFNHSLKLKSQKLDIKISDRKFSFKADLSILHKVIYRLVDNAIKFGDENSTVSVLLSPSDSYEKDQKVSFSISNQGPPLTQEVINKILKPFTLNENIMNHNKGVGLGLTYCQALLKTHNSYLNFKSENNRITVSFII